MLDPSKGRGRTDWPKECEPKGQGTECEFEAKHVQS